MDPFVIFEDVTPPMIKVVEYTTTEEENIYIYPSKFSTEKEI